MNFYLIISLMKVLADDIMYINIVFYKHFAMESIIFYNYNLFKRFILIILENLMISIIFYF